jgi:hypothetical protein
MFGLSALGSGLVAAAYVPAAGAAVSRSAMTPVTVTGKFVKSLSKTSFSMTSGMKSYVVTINDMTHIKGGMKTVKLSSLKKGESVTAKGPLEMHTISATTITVGM